MKSQYCPCEENMCERLTLGALAASSRADGLLEHCHLVGDGSALHGHPGGRAGGLIVDRNDGRAVNVIHDGGVSSHRRSEIVIQSIETVTTAMNCRYCTRSAMSTGRQQQQSVVWKELGAERTEKSSPACRGSGSWDHARDELRLTEMRFHANDVAGRLPRIGVWRRVSGRPMTAEGVGTLSVAGGRMSRC